MPQRVGCQPEPLGEQVALIEGAKRQLLVMCSNHSTYARTPTSDLRKPVVNSRRLRRACERLQIPVSVRALTPSIAQGLFPDRFRCVR